MPATIQPFNAAQAAIAHHNRKQPKPIVPLTPPALNTPSPHPLITLAEKTASLFNTDPSIPRHTHYIILLDESGSMNSIRKPTIEGFQQQVQTMQEGAKDTGITTYTFLKFSHNVSLLQKAVPIQHAQTITTDTYKPSGGTALLDAIGAAIETIPTLPGITGTDTAVFMLAFTDGEERDSLHVSAPVAAKAIELLSTSDLLTLSLVGTSLTLADLGTSLKLNAGNLRSYNPASTESTTDSLHAICGATAQYASSRSKGSRSTKNLFSDNSPNNPPTP